MSEAMIVLQGSGLDATLAERLARAAGCALIDWRAPGVCRLHGAAPDGESRRALAREADAAGVDCAFVDAPRRLPSLRVAVMDMDSTLITIECIDEIADMLGIKPAVAAITEAAMRGELVFAESLTRRVALLEGLPVEDLDRVYTERLRLSPGAESLIAAFRNAGIRTLLVSGGFTHFADRVAARLGIDEARANRLEVSGGRLTGRIDGPIVDAETKRQALLSACAALGVSAGDAIAIGDGANDLPMMEAAGVSIAYRAKPVVRARANHAINHNGLDAVLPLFET